MVIKTIGLSGSNADFICPGTNGHQAKIKEVLDSLTTGDILRFYPGTYIFDYPISITKTGLSITSYDTNNMAVLKVREVPGNVGWGSWISLLTCNNMNISYLIFDGSSGRPGMYEVDGWFNLVNIGSNSTIENCRLKNCRWTAITMDSYNKVLNNYFYNVKHDAIAQNHGSNYCLVDGNIQEIPSAINEPVASWANNFLRLYSGHDNIYSKNMLIHQDQYSVVMQMMFQLIGSSDRDSSNNTFVNNVCDAAYYAPIWFWESGYSPKTRPEFSFRGTVIRNNLFLQHNSPVANHAAGHGISFSSTYQNANLNGIIIENNTIIALKYGLYEYTTYNTDAAYGKQYCGCTYNGNSFSCEWCDPINFTGSRVVLSDIIVRNNIIISQQTAVKIGKNGNPGAFNVNNNCIYTPSAEKFSPGIITGTNIFTNPSLDSTYRVPIGNPAYGLGANIDLLPPPYGNGTICPRPQFNFDITQV